LNGLTAPELTERLPEQETKRLTAESRKQNDRVILWLLKTKITMQNARMDFFYIPAKMF
jgi:hypothetical protein